MPRKTTLFTLLALGAFLLIGLHLRIVSVSETEVIFPLRADAGHYFMYAFNLRHKHTYSSEIGNLADPKSPVTPDALRSPGYPLFLTLFVDTPPNKRLVDRILVSQAILSTLTILMAFFFLRGFLSPPLGLIGALLVALSPHLIVANSYLLTETLFCFFIVLLGCFVGLFASRPSLWISSILGVVIGLAGLVRPSLQYFPILIAFLLVFHFGWRKGIRFFVVLLIGFALAYSPWIIRNMVTLGKTGDNRLMVNFLHHGMYPNFTYNDIKESHGFPYRFDPRSDEIGKNVPSVLKEISARFAQQTAKHLKWYLLEKPLTFWSWNIIQGSGDAFIYPVSTSPYFKNSCFRWTRLLMVHLHWPIVLLAMFGCLTAWLPLAGIGLHETSIFTARFSSLLFLYFTLIHLVGAPFPRYSVPLRPLLYGLALFPLYFLSLALRKRYQTNTAQTS